jgi:biotin carboxyl carrier protein
MNEPILLVKVTRSDDGTIDVLAPAVGWWSSHPHAGALLGPGAGVGFLDYQNRRYRLVLPEGAAGRLGDGVRDDHVVAVEYGEVLFRLRPVATGDAEAFEGNAGALGHPAGVDLPPGARAVVAPTDGVFYVRPAPDADPFVRAGDRIRAGQTLGLVEVMKTFNQIRYGGPGFPEEAEVLEIRVDDAAEIRAGQVLVVVG